ncbi:MAG: hypothetical protein WDW36_005853 [Sanguina aurantia]
MSVKARDGVVLTQEQERLVDQQLLLMDLYQWDEQDLSECIDFLTERQEKMDGEDWGVALEVEEEEAFEEEGEEGA